MEPSDETVFFAGEILGVYTFETAIDDEVLSMIDASDHMCSERHMSRTQFA